MRNVFLVLAITYLAGCASNQLGDVAHISSVDDTRSSSALKISARFSPYYCSDYFAYLDFSIENPTSKWQIISDLELGFPYQSNDLFDVVTGERLALWREGEGHRQKLQRHNDGVTSLAVAGVGLGLMAVDNEAAQVAGAALYAGNAVSELGSDIASDINRVETAVPVFANYLVGRDIEVPPGMTRKFWLVLSAQEQAPLMASIGGVFDDNEGVQQVFKMPLEGWENCQWQGERKAFLRSRLERKSMKQQIHDTGIERNNLRLKMAALINKENELQQAKLSQQVQN
ncbi:hypothetical protein QNI23_002875 [Bermanella sp. WJH001]|uniref:hypothetical protein n=1 Tax=Bermanella sp. WJH001 TaxID=3048005 RepID=UPI0024BEA395|nr:hypothetical protein [Bermanella sp. WJH001]MDJ1538297.1 hypothetical protein [Bermanella sp. WJH001]